MNQNKTNITITEVNGDIEILFGNVIKKCLRALFFSLFHFYGSFSFHFMIQFSFYLLIDIFFSSACFMSF